MQHLATVGMIFFFTNLAFAQVTVKSDSPAECIARLHEAQAEKDDAALLGCLTEAAQCQTLGQVAFELERLVLFQTPQAAGASVLLEKHGVSGVDIIGQMQLLASTNNNPHLAWVHGGAWVREPVAFLKAGKELLEKAQQDRQAALARTPEQIRQEFAKQRQRAATEEAKQEVDEAERQALAEAKEAQAVAKEMAPKPDSPAPQLSQLKIDGELAEGQLQRGDGPKSPAVFRHIGGGWYLALSRDEPAVQRPSKTDRALMQFAGRGLLDLDPIARADQALPIAFYYHGDDFSRSPLTDADLAVLATFPSLNQVEIERAAQVTDAGVAALSALKNLGELKIANVLLTSECLKRLAALPSLNRLELENIDLSNESLAAFRKARPNCAVTEAFYLRGTRYEGNQTLADVRDKNRVTLLFVFGGQHPFLASATGMKELIQQIERSNVQVIDDLPYWNEGKPEWWQRRPYLKPNVLPQFAVFPKGDKKPVLLTENITVGDVAKAITDALAQGN